MTKKILLVLFFVSVCFAPVSTIFAERVVTYKASDLAPHVEIFPAPKIGTFQEGSTFEVPIFINTKGNNINAIELNIKFDQDKLSIVNPSGGKSIIGLWVEPPSYNNTKGTARIVGAIPNGITTDSGLIVTITFQAKISGQATISLINTSQVLLNDGMGSAAILDTTRGVYTIVPKPPEGVLVFSDTHPFQDHWYNNNNPVLEWNKDPGVTGFSFILDNKPNTIPDNTVTTTDTTKAYQNLSDGLWYFHIKALKNGVWGNTTDYLVRVDTTPPAEFKPTLDYVSATAINRFLVSFFTTDSLSGVDHYEVGVIDKSQPVTDSPAFIQVESPYQIPFDTSKNLRVIVRAFDKAGNVRDESLDATVPFLPWKYVVDHAVQILLSILGLILFLLLIHYLFGHRILRRLRRGMALAEQEEHETYERGSRKIYVQSAQQPEVYIPKQAILESSIPIQPVPQIQPTPMPQSLDQHPVIPNQVPIYKSDYEPRISEEDLLHEAHLEPRSPLELK